MVALGRFGSADSELLNMTGREEVVRKDGRQEARTRPKKISSSCFPTTAPRVPCSTLSSTPGKGAVEATLVKSEVISVSSEVMSEVISELRSELSSDSAPLGLRNTRRTWMRVVELRRTNLL